MLEIVGTYKLFVNYILWNGICVMLILLYIYIGHGRYIYIFERYRQVYIIIFKYKNFEIFLNFCHKLPIFFEITAALADFFFFLNTHWNWFNWNSKSYVKFKISRTYTHNNICNTIKLRYNTVTCCWRLCPAGLSKFLFELLIACKN